MNKIKRCNNQTRIDIDLNSAILTYKTVSRIFLSVVEFLSYNRNQIPLVYGTFNNMVQNLEKAIADESVTGTGVKNFTLERQRVLAIRTNKKFHEIFDVSETNDIAIPFAAQCTIQRRKKQNKTKNLFNLSVAVKILQDT